MQYYYIIFLFKIELNNSTIERGVVIKFCILVISQVRYKSRPILLNFDDLPNLIDIPTQKFDFDLNLLLINNNYTMK